MHLMHAQFPIFSIAGSNNVHYNGLKTSLTFHVTSYNSTAVRETEGSEENRNCLKGEKGRGKFGTKGER